MSGNPMTRTTTPKAQKSLLSFFQTTREENPSSSSIYSINATWVDPIPSSSKTKRVLSPDVVDGGSIENCVNTQPMIMKNSKKIDEEFKGNIITTPTMNTTRTFHDLTLKSGGGGTGTCTLLTPICGQMLKSEVFQARNDGDEQCEEDEIIVSPTVHLLY